MTLLTTFVKISSLSNMIRFCKEISRESHTYTKAAIGGGASVTFCHYCLGYPCKVYEVVSIRYDLGKQAGLSKPSRSQIYSYSLKVYQSFQRFPIHVVLCRDLSYFHRQMCTSIMCLILASNFFVVQCD